MSESIDFKQITAPVHVGYLQPGMYRLQVDPKETKVIEPLGKTPYLSVRLADENGNSVVEKFYLTSKALPRLQYLHEGWFGKGLDKTFTSMVQVGEYFQKALTSKLVSRMIVVGGKLTPDGKFYSGLPFDRFIILDEKEFEEGPFEKGCALYNKVVKVEKPNPLVALTNDAILPSAEANKGDFSNPWD